MDRILAGQDCRAGRRAAGLGIGGGQDQPFGGDLVDIGGCAADRDATAIEAEVHPADVVEQEDEDVGLLAGLLLELG